MNFQTICRICIGKNSGMISIFGSYNFSTHSCEIFKVITDCASVQIDKFDGFSEQICPRCLYHLYQAYSFKKLCEDSDYKFRNGLIANDKIEIKDDFVIEDTISNCGEINNDTTTNTIEGTEGEELDIAGVSCNEFENMTRKGLSSLTHCAKNDNIELSSYKCEPCCTTFDTEEKLALHMKLHSERQHEKEADSKFGNDLTLSEEIEIKSECTEEDNVSNYDDLQKNTDETTDVGLSQEESFHVFHTNPKIEEYFSKNEEIVQPQKKIKADINWEKKRTFPDEKTAKEAIEKEDSWSIRTRYTDSSGYKIVRYRCNKVKVRGEQCAAIIRLIYNSNDGEAVLYQSMPFRHNHDEILTGTKFCEAVKNKIRIMLENDSRIKPKKILRMLADEQLKVPTKTQVNNYLSWLRRKKIMQ